MRTLIDRRALAALAALACLGAYAATGPAFHLREVSVVGDSWAVGPEDVRAGLEKSGTMSLLYGEYDELTSHLSSIPGVRSVLLGMSWPDSIVIDVQARRPYARSADGGLVDSNGEWYDSAAGNGLPIFSMPKARLPEAVEFHSWAGGHLDRLGLGITQVRHSGAGWQVFLNNGWVLQLGDHRLRERFNRFVGAYPDFGRAFGRDRNIRLDLRYPNAIAVAGWTGGGNNE